MFSTLRIDKLLRGVLRGLLGDQLGGLPSGLLGGQLSDSAGTPQTVPAETPEAAPEQAQTGIQIIYTSNSSVIHDEKFGEYSGNLSFPFSTSFCFWCPCSIV